MFRKNNFKIFLTYALVIGASPILISCGKPISAAKPEATGGGNGGGGGGVPTPPPSAYTAVSCNLVVGTPTYTNAPLTLTVVGNVDRVTIDGQTMPNPDAVTRTLAVNYPVSLPGAKNVNAVVQNVAGGTSNTCSTSFIAPNVGDARKTAAPNDGNNYTYSTDFFITENNNVTYRYTVAVSKMSGQGWYNSISLDPLHKPGLVDAWSGWKVIPGQPVGTGTIFPIAVVKYGTTGNVYTISAINFDGTAVVTAATCNNGACTFTPWAAY